MQINVSVTSWRNEVLGYQRCICTLVGAMSTRSMSIKVFCYGVIYFLCQVALSDCEVTWVTRNDTDSFRIDYDGCLKDVNVCTRTASCQNDGSCLCNKHEPYFRNPIIISGGSNLSFGNSYGCITRQYVVFSNTLFGEYIFQLKALFIKYVKMYDMNYVVYSLPLKVKLSVILNLFKLYHMILNNQRQLSLITTKTGNLHHVSLKNLKQRTPTITLVSRYPG